MRIGIEKINFFTPPTYLNMVDLAKNREVDPNKYLIGIGQSKMAIASHSYDTVAIAANAADQLLTEKDKKEIDMVLLGTETGVDQSKSAATWVHKLIGIQPHARAIELKQACYSGTAAIQLAMGHIALHPESKVLILASDIAKYGLESGGEPTQGAGAVAILMSSNPNVLSIEKESGTYTKEISDFWRPNYSDFPFVDGKYSVSAYLDTLMASWTRYKNLTNNRLTDFEAILFHVPYTKMGWKALNSLEEKMDEKTFGRFSDYYESAIVYNKIVGNIYTGSLYLSLISLLEQSKDLSAGSRIGMFSYGSGSVGEFFVGVLEENYEKYLFKNEHEKMLQTRQELSFNAYEDILSESVKVDEEGNLSLEEEYVSKEDFIFTGIVENKRQYKKS